MDIYLTYNFIFLTYFLYPIPLLFLSKDKRYWHLKSFDPLKVSNAARFCRIRATDPCLIRFIPDPEGGRGVVALF